MDHSDSPCTVEELAARMSESPRSFLILDVREPEECDIVFLPGALNIPLASLPNRIAELEAWTHREVLALCHHGVRSASACRFLRQAGFANVRNISGGIDAYAAEADPSLARY